MARSIVEETRRPTRGGYGQPGLLPVPATGRGNPGGRGQLVEFLLHVAREERLVTVSGQQAHQQRRKPGWRWPTAIHHCCPPPKSGERSCIIRASMAVECRSARVPAAVRAQYLPGATALDRLRIGQAEPHQPFVLEPREGGVDGANRDRASCPLFDVAADGDAVRGLPLPGQRQHPPTTQFPDESLAMFYLQTRT